MEICNESICCGCFACKARCPMDAIESCENEFGETIPKINMSKCIECGLCIKICPVNNPPQYSTSMECYALWTKNIEDRKFCASGGVATGIARNFVQNHNIVFGTTYERKLDLIITYAETEKDIMKFRGSKYVQSNTKDSYQKVKEFLESDRTVLYNGTPCQIAGLKNYLGKEYSKLYLIDIVCHGVPPLRYLKDYCKEMLNREDIETVEFRGEHDFNFVAKIDDKVVYKQKFTEDMYFTAFLKGLIHREGCYNCQYASGERISDLTIGDFWGIRREDLKERYDGKISLALVNTLKGKQLLNEISEDFILEKRTFGEAAEKNAQLRRPSCKHKDREKFLNNYVKDGFVKSIQSTGIRKSILWAKIKEDKYLKKIRKLIKGILGRG